jgi:hypothetical protein
MKKAWTRLDDKGVAYQFHDYKKAGIDRDTLTGWVDKLGWEVLLNRAGTTFKKLPDAAKADIDRDRAIGKEYGLPYAEQYHYIGPEPDEVGDYIKQNARPR